MGTETLDLILTRLDHFCTRLQVTKPKNARQVIKNVLDKHRIPIKQARNSNQSGYERAEDLERAKDLERNMKQILSKEDY